MIISNEGKTGFDGLLFRHRHDSVRLGEIRKDGSYARSDAGDVSLCWRASERDGAYRCDGDNRDVREFLTNPLRDSGKCACRSGPDEDPIDTIEFTHDLIRRLLRMRFLVGDIGVLIEPEGIWIRAQDLVDFLQPASQVPSHGVPLFHDDYLCPIELHPPSGGAICIRVGHANEFVAFRSADEAQGEAEIA